ncbi:sugar phosphate isomerase/epimerase family protein [uncultured Amnibacterium sp.]|uniref:sugar phosphate isomerase/epimerase family protein n=1 Tax=uncultured Amnibacterium sp. TaxID=1631851 RepID=UPI0035CB89FB
MSAQRVSIATISLPDLEPAAAIEQIANAGFGGIEWRVEPRPGAVRDMASAHPFLADGHRATIRLDEAHARDTAAATRAAGLAVVGLAPYVELGDEETLATAFRLAEAAGAPQIRLQAPRPGRTGLGYWELLDRFRAFFSIAAATAARTGISALIEIHHLTICASGELAHRVLADHDPDHVGAIYDVGNLVWEGYVDHELALDLLGTYLRHVHIKNATILRAPGGTWRPAWTPLEDGIVDIPRFAALLQRRGYQGWMSVEELSQDRTPTDALVHNADQLREWGLLPASGVHRDR